MRTQNLLRSVQEALGFGWSFLIYYGLPFHHEALVRMYAPFIRRGDLCFDIGAHLGDRIHAWTRLGARVIALEPNPGMMNWLQRWYGNQRNVVLVEQAVSAQPGVTDLWISRLTPSVSTISRAWLTQVQKNRRFAGVHWEERIPVAVTTLDALIAKYGNPAFCKIDVEGAEWEVLRGLSQPVPALSFEYLPATIETAISCIERLCQLGEYEYNWRVSEWPRLRSPVWLSPEDMIAGLRRMSLDDNSGDVYARLSRM
jgi:FkbM family methyltransferase